MYRWGKLKSPNRKEWEADPSGASNPPTRHCVRRSKKDLCLLLPQSRQPIRLSSADKGLSHGACLGSNVLSFTRRRVHQLDLKKESSVSLAESAS